MKSMHQPDDEPLAPSRKFSVDTRISINTVIACLTLAGMGVAIMDRFSSYAATIAVIQNKQVAVDHTIAGLTAQRFSDRQEILLELKDIKSEIRDINKVHRK